MGYGSHCSGLDKPRKIGVAQLMELYPIVNWPTLTASQGFVRPYYLIVPEFDGVTDICTPVRTVKYPLRYSIYLDEVLINGGSIGSTSVWLDANGQQIEFGNYNDVEYFMGPLVGSLVYNGEGHWAGSVSPPLGGSIDVDAVLGSCVPSSGLLVTYSGSYRGTGTGYNNSIRALHPDTLWLGETWFDGLNSWGGDIALNHPDGLYPTLPKIYQGVPNKYDINWDSGITLLSNQNAGNKPITRITNAPVWDNMPTWPDTLDVDEKGYALLVGSLRLTIGTATGNKQGGYTTPYKGWQNSLVYTQQPQYPNPLVSELPDTVTVTPDYSGYV